MTTVHSSVVIALFNRADPEHGAAMAWLRQAIDDGEPLRAPITLLGDVACGISRGSGDKQLGREVATQVQHSPLFELLPVALPLAERAAAIAAEHRLSGADSLYLAVAETLSDRLVAVDEALLQQGAHLVATVRPEAI